MITNVRFTIPELGKPEEHSGWPEAARNPSTGEAIKIKAKTTVKFRLAKAAKDAVVLRKA